MTNYTDVADWALKELNIVIDEDVRNSQAFKSMTESPVMLEKWSHVMRHVKSKSNVRFIRGNLQILRNERNKTGVGDSMLSTTFAQSDLNDQHDNIESVMSDFKTVFRKVDNALTSYTDIRKQTLKTVFVRKRNRQQLWNESYVKSHLLSVYEFAEHSKFAENTIPPLTDARNLNSKVSNKDLTTLANMSKPFVIDNLKSMDDDMKTNLLDFIAYCAESKCSPALKDFKMLVKFDDLKDEINSSKKKCQMKSEFNKKYFYQMNQLPLFAKSKYEKLDSSTQKFLILPLARVHVDLHGQKIKDDEKIKILNEKLHEKIDSVQTQNPSVDVTSVCKLMKGEAYIKFVESHLEANLESCEEELDDVESIKHRWSSAISEVKDKMNDEYQHFMKLLNICSTFHNSLQNVHNEIEKYTSSQLNEICDTILKFLKENDLQKLYKNSLESILSECNQYFEDEEENVSDKSFGIQLGIDLKRCLQSLQFINMHDNRDSLYKSMEQKLNELLNAMSIREKVENEEILPMLKKQLNELNSSTKPEKVSKALNDWMEEGAQYCISHDVSVLKFSRRVSSNVDLLKCETLSKYQDEYRTALSKWQKENAR